MTTTGKFYIGAADRGINPALEKLDRILELLEKLDEIIELLEKLDEIIGLLNAVLTRSVYRGEATGNWFSSETEICTLGSTGTVTTVSSLLLDIGAMAGVVTIRFYAGINGVQRQVYAQTFTVAADGPGLYMINGTLAINGELVITARSNNSADEGKSIGWEFIQGGV